MRVSSSRFIKQSQSNYKSSTPNRMTGKEYLEYMSKNKKSNKENKYNNRKVEVDGFKFDSKLEADYYIRLKLLKRAGEIQSFTLQPEYLLLDGFKKDGKVHRPIKYIADFEIKHNDGTIEVVDTKGVKTQVFRIKEKLFHYRYPYKLTLVTKKDI